MFVVITTRQPLLFSFKRSIYAGMTVLWATRCTENVRRQLTRDVKPNVTGVPGFWLLTALALNVINSVVDNFYTVWPAFDLDFCLCMGEDHRIQNRAHRSRSRIMVSKDGNVAGLSTFLDRGQFFRHS